MPYFPPAVNVSSVVSADVQAYNGGALAAAETFMRRASSQALGAYVSSGVMLHSALWLPAGFVVTNLTAFTSASVSASGITNWWFALYDTQATPALMAQTADQLTATIANNSKFTLALSAPQTITVAGVYYAAVMAKGTTPPSWDTTNMGNANVAGGVGAQMRLQGTSGSGLSTTAPATITSASASAFGPLLVAT